MSNQPTFDVVCLAGHQGLVQGEDATVLVRVDVQLPPALRRVSRQRANQAHLGLALDVSGSMLGSLAAGPTKLDALVDAAIRVVERGRAGDRMTTLHFSATAGTPVTSDAGDRARMLDAVRAAHTFPHSTTNMTAGLETLLAAMADDDAPPRTALLFTDGMPDEPDGPRHLAARFAEAGIALSVVGFGDDLRLSYVEELAALGRGQVFAARDVATLERQLGETLDQSQQVAVSGLRAHLEFAPCVIPLEVYRAKPQSQLLRRFEPTIRSYRFAIGNLGAEAWQTLFVRFQVRGDQLPPVGRAQVLLKLTVTGVVPSQQRATQSVSAHVELPVSASAMPHNHCDVDDAFQMVQLMEVSKQFEARCRERRYDLARDLAVQLRRAYQQIGTPEALAADAVLERTLQSLDRQGAISLEELERLLNDGVTSRTASGVQRALQPSQTLVGGPARNSGATGFGH
ncbi:MAG: VWA domain-containing protein [Deltaproteobacteria bacterium]|nr:VWA domain-containing protein [Myxococcales bacterium]MDP3216488.1 VWA domain-containing protein [Deltaproteobacteria bacterium]